ncbi:MAG: 30S ribosomal protein S6 [Thermotogota bacterium]|nr:30S ribosomal protein S6 [Thermotogota bacterium]
MKKQRIYETMFIIDPNLEDEAREAVAEKIKKQIEERVQGIVRKLNRWGVRKLAYRLGRGFTEGDYTIIIFEADPENVDILEKFYKITPEVFRWQTFRREDLEKSGLPKEMLKEEDEEKVDEAAEEPVEKEETPESSPEESVTKESKKSEE